MSGASSRTSRSSSGSRMRTELMFQVAIRIVASDHGDVEIGQPVDMAFQPVAAGNGRHAFRRAREDQVARLQGDQRSEEHTSELQSLMRISYAAFCLKKKKKS